MFDRFIRLARARKALREQRFEEALSLAGDPLIRGDRRAEQVRTAASAALLARAQRHVDAADLSAARIDARRVAAAAPDGQADELCRRIDAAVAGAATELDLARRSLAEVRKLLDRGETAAAAALLATVPAASMLLERKQVDQLLGERRRQAELAAERASAALAAGDVDAAVIELDRLLALDRDSARLAGLTAQVGAALARRLEAAVAERLAAGDAVGAARQVDAFADRVPGISAAAIVASVRAPLLAALSRTLHAAPSLGAALDAIAAMRGLGLAPETSADPLVAAVVRAAGAGGSDEAVAAARCLAAAAATAGASGLARAARDLEAAAEVCDRQLDAARRHVDRGELEQARATLQALLTREPEHDQARRELGMVDHGLSDLRQRLEAARDAARGGRLREACALAVALVGADRVAGDAQQLVADVRARMALVDRGVDEIRVALHGRLAAGPEGVRHCLRRLQELAKVQVDHADLPTLTRAVEAEIEALGHCEAAAAALAQQSLDDAVAPIAALQPLVGDLLARDRLDARVGGLVDRLVATGERALATGQLAMVDRCAELCLCLPSQSPEFAARAEALRAASQRGREAAQGLAAAAREQLAARDLDEAERLADAARAQWQEGDEIRRLTAELEQLRRQTVALERVERLARERDYVGAQHKLAAMPPTQPMLRTRIYDMKQDLARAQGLDGAFLLRVDEGGEHLVQRGETVSIGNVQKRRADLPILASLAGRHASVRRSMSFHGGMQDTVVADEGEVRVAGLPTTSRPLAHGDRVQLGQAFAFVYERPSERSLTAALRLQAGFQVAGTDRILLMKDRGRDGRILLGPGRDVHVRVAKATGEVEVYATSSGQMRVHSAAGGTIDGVAFRGEHPVAAGQVVAAAGISFVLYPWHAGS